MNKEDLEKLSDRSIDRLVAVASGYGADYIERNPDNAPNYCEIWSDMGPLIEGAGISVTYMLHEGWDCHALIDDGNGHDEKYNTMHENPLRAAAIVYLLMQE